MDSIWANYNAMMVTNAMAMAAIKTAKLRLVGSVLVDQIRKKIHVLRDKHQWSK